jgi:hypothetical protein
MTSATICARFRAGSASRNSVGWLRPASVAWKRTSNTAVYHQLGIRPSSRAVVLERVDFSGRTVDGFEFPEIFPHGLSIAADGFGNSWVLDLAPGAVEAAPV